tara:strand:+ start:776 stop:916 length:141 start_codon:yes stop_codon:yes gene_type:complete
MTPLIHANTLGKVGTLLGSAYHDSEREWRLKVRERQKEIENTSARE